MLWKLSWCAWFYLNPRWAFVLPQVTSPEEMTSKIGHFFLLHPCAGVAPNKAQTGNALQHTAPHWTALQHTAPHCTTLHHTAPHCTTLHHTAPHCTTSQRTAPNMAHIDGGSCTKPPPKSARPVMLLLVRSLTTHVSFAEEPCKRDIILQNKPIFTHRVSWCANMGWLRLVGSLKT